MKLIPSMIALAALAAPAAALDQSGSSPGGQAQQHAQALQNLPEQARNNLVKEAAQHEARIASVDRKDGDAFSYWTAKLENQDRSWTVKVADTGTIIGIQNEPIAFEKLPRPVQEALLKEAGKNDMITEIVTTRRNGQKAYKAELESQGKGRDLVLSESGQKLPVMVGGESGTSSGASSDMHQPSEQMSDADRKELDQQRKDIDQDLQKLDKQIDKQRKELQQQSQ